MRSLNATREAPEDWSGNEPDEWAPWEFDYFGAPDETQRFVRAIADNEFADAPVDEPGNDDLGALSSWYVWAALGLFPVTPGAGNLALASPLFPSATVTLPDGRHLVEQAPEAAASRPYVRALTVSGVTRPLGPPVRVHGGSSVPRRRWKLGLALASRLGSQDRWDPALHPLEHRGPGLGILASGRAAVLRSPGVPGRRVFTAQRPRDGGSGTADDDPDRRGSGRGSSDGRQLAGASGCERTDGHPVVGRAHRDAPQQDR